MGERRYNGGDGGLKKPMEGERERERERRKEKSVHRFLSLSLSLTFSQSRKAHRYLFFLCLLTESHARGENLWEEEEGRAAAAEEDRD